MNHVKDKKTEESLELQMCQDMRKQNPRTKYDAIKQWNHGESITEAIGCMW